MIHKLSSHFYREEFTCPCGCGGDVVDAKLLTVIQWLRYDLVQPITITSGYRCRSHNKAVGGSTNSFHLSGKAADFKVKQYTPEYVYEHIHKHFPNTLGLIQYETWVHVDVRPEPYRSIKHANRTQTPGLQEGVRTVSWEAGANPSPGTT